MSTFRAAPVLCPSWAVLVSSCDAYSDLWPYFFHFLFKFWPDVPQPVYLISNHFFYNDPRVKTIQVGEDLQWGANTSKAVGQIPAESLLLLLDDFLLDAPFNTAAFEKLLGQYTSSKGRLVELRLFGQQGELIPDTWFRQADASNLCAGINSNLWDRELLVEIAKPGRNIWQCETGVRDLLRAGEKGLYFMDTKAPRILSFVESVRGQFWKPEGIAFLKNHGILPDLKRRPFPPQGRDFFSKLSRSYHKYWMKKRMVSILKKQSDVIQPYFT
jgi:hypothetical protein